MLVDSYILPECIASPRSFGGLMALYEANFIKLNQLVEGLDSRTDYRVSYSTDDGDLHLSIENRSKYTCELRLTYYFPEDGTEIADPDLVARVYFDARMAEVCGWKDAHRHELLRQLSRRYLQQLDLCWTRNIVFSKWLEYLLDHGHRFRASEPAGTALNP